MTRKIRDSEIVVPNFDKSKLPFNWELVDIGSLCIPIENIDPKREPKKEFYYIDISSIDNKRFRILDGKKLTGIEAPSRARQIVKTGDIIFSTVRTYLKNFAIVTETFDGQIASTGFCVLRPAILSLSKWIFYFVQYQPILDFLSSLQRGTSYPAVRDSDVFAQIIPLPPIEESNRIIAEIEKQFSRLDEAVENLQRVKANLKRYKASVLKAAVEGKLTEQWRTEHPDVEPASQLLERILKERRKKWEENELAKMKAKGKVPKDEKWKNRYKKPPTVDLLDLPKIFSSWRWATFAEISDRVTVGHVGPMKDEYVESGIPFLRSQNVRENRFDPEGLKFISQQFHQRLDKSVLEPGDIVIVRSGDVGVSCVIPSRFEEANCSDLVIIKHPMGILPDYGAYYMNSIKNTRVSSKKVGVALIHFNTQSAAEMPIPIPPFEEQRDIVARVKKLTSLAEQIEIAVDKNLIRAAKLRQTILHNAFFGQLVSQDPNDEPAKELLARVKDERMRQVSEIKKQHGKGTGKMASKEQSKTRRDIILVLKEAKKHMRPEELFQIAGYKPEEVDQFYADLKRADQEKAISQEKKSNGNVFLKVQQ